jgi:hypothetical protein
MEGASFREGFDRNSVRSSDYNAEEASAKPRAKSERVKKNISKSWHVFGRQKSVVQAPRFTMQFTTTSPRFTIKKHHKNAKTPAKTTLHPQNIFF